MKQITRQTLAAIKSGAFLLALLPLADLAFGALEQRLGANPYEHVLHELGTWALNFILITLLIAPLRRALGWDWLLRLRRMAGLYAFFYGSLHLLAYLWFDQDFVWHEIAHDVAQRPFIAVGLAAFLLMLPLALSSSAAAIRRLGAQRWLRLHRAVYAIGILAAVHYWWLVKKDITKPLIYALILGTLLGLRLLYRLHRARAAAPDRA